ncbi:serine hydrolase domain-containing protein [Brevibacillus ginsengisoli]|uniref:serine hydrolase domain-containing protein n=1 Tax=Brevibacillus ginsengisoli TaxID=363854 RepID=UPI003CF80556
MKLNLDERLKHYHVAGLSLAVIENGKLVLSRGHGVMERGTNHQVDSRSIFHACSISKLATSMLVLTLVERNILDLDRDVNDTLKSWKVPANEFTQHKKVTLRTLLSHQSGFIDPESSFSPFDPNQGIPAMLDLMEGRTSYCSEPFTVKYEPASSFHYSDAGFCLIEQLIEEVTQKSFQRLMNDLIFEPLQMKDSLLEYRVPEEIHQRFTSGHHKDGKVVNGKYPIYPYLAAAGLWSTPTDLSSLVIELMNSLNGKGKLGISPQLCRDMISPQGCSQWTGLGVFLDNSNQELEIYSLGWGVGFQCMLLAYPYVGAGAVIMTNTDLGVHQTKGIIGEIVNDLSFGQKNTGSLST